MTSNNISLGKGEMPAGHSGGEATRLEVNASLPGNRYGVSFGSLPPNKRLMISYLKERSNGGDAAIAPSEQPSYAAEDVVINDDTQIDQKTPNDSSSTSHKLEKGSPSSHMPKDFLSTADKAPDSTAAATPRSVSIPGNSVSIQGNMLLAAKDKVLSKRKRGKGDEVQAKRKNKNERKVVASDLMRLDRGVIKKCHNLYSTLRSWNVEKEDVVSLIKKSGLFHLRRITYEHLDWPLLTAFIERWNSKTNSFHLPLGEMTITLHDTHFLLHLPIRGRPVIPTLDGVSALSFALQWTKKEVKETLWEAGRLSLKKLNALDKPGRDANIVAKAYLLSLLGTSLFVNKSANSVNGSFIQLLDDLESVDTYAWGAAALANLYSELGSASRDGCRQMAGCLTLLQAWIYAYFPELRPLEQSDWKQGSPHASRWILSKGSNEKDVQSLERYRLYLDHCSASSVDWTPFSANSAAEFPISLDEDTIRCRKSIERYNPYRVLRQFGRS